MSSTARTLGRKTLAALLIYVLASGVGLAAVLKFQLWRLAVDEQTAMGDALAGQLVESVRQPLLDANLISIQVILDSLVTDTPQVGRASVYNAANQLLAQSQAPLRGGESLSDHSAPITVDNTLSGHVRIELRTEPLTARYNTVLWWALGAWGVATLALAGWLLLTTFGFSRRLARINASLLSAPDPESHRYDELSLLERRLEPLLDGGSGGETPEHDRHCILAFNLANLPRLRAQLNTDHFNSILTTIDQRVEQAKNLFRGVRLQAQHNAIFVQFSTLANEEEHLLHAVSCGAALMTLCRELEQDEGLPLELRLAIAPFTPPEGSRWGSDLSLEDCVEHLVELLQVANPWEMLIDSALITQEELSFCDTDPLSSSPAQLFRGFTPQQHLTHERQVDFLRGRKLPAIP
ncbi:MAG: hypothetical protein RBR91_04240 [Porticoccaceae bacterium]|jgi:uncharacterized membrane protein affecting hemolysin expression|nr:hypothetical protein [Porticoccaceae bacterium]MEA3299879.1 hypothetical protein [Pseudomonadota bacterium]HLS97838.1 hypothetical protein [Porticoccaceae bacterium]